MNKSFFSSIAILTASLAFNLTFAQSTSIQLDAIQLDPSRDPRPGLVVTIQNKVFDTRYLVPDSDPDMYYYGVNPKLNITLYQRSRKTSEITSKCYNHVMETYPDVYNVVYQGTDTTCNLLPGEMHISAVNLIAGQNTWTLKNSELINDTMVVRVPLTIDRTQPENGDRALCYSVDVESLPIYNGPLVTTPGVAVVKACGS